MKEIIKKILREYNELDWIDDEINADVEVTVDNIYYNAKVKLKILSEYYGGNDQLNNNIGVIKNYSKDSLHSNLKVNGYWAHVVWPGGAEFYRIGPDEFDLVFAT
jgi:hypothetical protein